MESAAGAREPALGHSATQGTTNRSTIIVRTPTRTPATPRPRVTKAIPAGEALPATPGTPRKKASAAGPRGKKASVSTTPVDVLDRLQAIITASLEDDKAEDLVVLDLAGRASFADRMVIATGLADRQISAIATHLEEKLKESGFPKPLTEGAGGSDWVLIDCGDIIVHLFKPESRAIYALEKMWGAELDETT
jgi:ribosome silencing factor RsfS/YbeB/iojap